MIEQPTRRGFVTGLVALIAAPAIVRASSLMPVKAWPGGNKFLTPELISEEAVKLYNPSLKMGDIITISWGDPNELPRQFIVTSSTKEVSEILIRDRLYGIKPSKQLVSLNGRLLG